MINKLSGQQVFTSFFKKGNTELERIRCEVDRTKLETLGDGKNEDNLQISLLNDYLNAYSEKIARATISDPSSIKIDLLEFYRVLKAAETDGYDPFEHYKILKAESQHLCQQAKDFNYMVTTSPFNE